MGGMIHDRKDLRPGDLVQCYGQVDSCDTNLWVTWDFDKLKIVSPALKKGDTVKWWDKPSSTWASGRVVGVDVEDDHTWVWVREAGRWPRLTFEAKELQRTALASEDSL